MITKPIPMFEGLFPENTILIKFDFIRVEEDGKISYWIETIIDPLFYRIMDAVNRILESQIEEMDG